MKLVSFASSGGWHPGVILDGVVFDIDKLLLDDEAPAGSLREILRRHGGALPELARRLSAAVERAPSARIGVVAEVVLGPPITDPAKVLCIGLNYKDHVAETGRALPQHPDVFAKFASTLIGPYDEIRCSSVSQNLDFEGEVAIVIGRDCRSVDESEALDAVAGLMVLNDLTARDLQYRGTQWLAGKAVDRSTPCGPSIVTLDEIGDPQNLDLTTRVNGVEMQASNTRHMIFPMAQLVAYLSTFLALAPGDIIATGTPQGIGAKRQPAVWLQRGDVVEIDVSRVGMLRNVVR